MELEEKVTKLVEEYGAPEYETRVILDFLIESGNIYSIEDIIKEENDEY